MKLVWTEQAWADYEFWVESDQAVVLRIHQLIKDMKRSPFSGIGKPEPSKGSLSGFWSRRITADHRIVYNVSGAGEDQRLQIIQCRYHYVK